MKSFLQFLKESNIDDSLNEREQKFFSVNDAGEVIEEDVNDITIDWHKFSTFFSEPKDVLTEDTTQDEDLGEYGKKGTTFGGEIIIDLDFEDKELEESTEDSENKKTLDYLKTNVIRNIEDVQKNAIKYKVEPENGIPGEDGKLKITARDYRDTDDSRHELTDDEIKYIINHLNTPPPPPVQYSLGDDGTVLENGKAMPRNRKMNFLKHLNTAVEVIKAINGDKTQRHYKWESSGEIKTYTEKDFKKNPKHQVGAEIPGSQFGKRILYNKGVHKWDDSDKQNLKKYDVDEYAPVEKGSEQEKELLGYIQKVQDAVELKGEYGWDSNIGTFTYAKYDDDGNPQQPKPIIGKELISFLNVRNSYMTLDKKQKGPTSQKEEGAGSYWRHFKVSMTGSKVGDVANFSLPPVMTCNREAPCIDDGCYAVKAVGIYPTSRISQEVNYALLKGGAYKQFEEEIGKVLALSKKNGDGTKSPRFEYFRFFVSGDMISHDMLNSICNIATSHSNIKFWMYTKQYKILHEHTGAIPSNLTILVSCWGKFNPKMYIPKGMKVENDENGNPIAPYADLAERFPLAYLDDNTAETRSYFEKKSGDEVCPCTDDDEVVARCDTCHKCFSVRANQGNIIFKKH